MIPVLDAQQVRDTEQVFFDAHPGIDLMQRAAEATAETALEMLGHRPGHVVVAAGAGNNAGDGLFAAARLATRRCRVDVWLALDKTHSEGLTAARQAGCIVVDAAAAAEALGEADLVIDAVFGIGGRPGLPDAVATFAAEAHDLTVPVLAVDLPSGLDTDSGRADETSFHATRTITFSVRKPCHVMQPAAQRCGEVVLADIGLDLPEPALEVAQAADVARLWPVPGPTSDKYSRGVVGIDTGSSRYPGAALLGTTGALYAGAGMIRFCGPENAQQAIGLALPSVTHGEGRVQAWLVGSGWGDDTGNRKRLAARLDEELPCVIDADALAVMPKKLPEGCLLTPHAGELAKLLGVERPEVEADPIGHARQAARRWQASVLLKGATQYVAEPDGRVRIAVPGPAWTGQAGSGDVLAGICATLLAAGLPAADAGLVGASAQAMAAGRRRGSFPPDVVAHEVAALAGEWGDLR